MNTKLSLLCTTCLLASTLFGCLEDDDDMSMDELRAGGLVYDAVANFNEQNPNGVWSYGYGSVGGDFTASPNYSVSGAFAYRGGGPSSDSWRGLHKNLTAQAQQRHTGLEFAPHALVMHPGNSANPLSKIRFTAPTAGCYDVDVTWTNINQQAKKTRPMLYTNAGGGFAEIFAQDLVGHAATASFAEMIELEVGEILSFELGNGGDGFYDDPVDIELFITEAICPPDKYFVETFSQSDVGPNLVDLQSKFVVGNGRANRSQTTGYGYLATEQTNYNEDDWTFDVDWTFAPWDMPYVGIGAAAPSNFNWVVGTPDQSVYLYARTHQPMGNPGRVDIIVQNAGWSRTIISIGQFVGDWGTYSVRVRKVGNAVTFSLFNPNKVLLGTGTINDITVTAPWLTNQNSRLFVGSVPAANTNAHTYWDNFNVYQ